MVTLCEAQNQDQLTRWREVANIIEAIDDTQPMFGVYQRLKQLVDEGVIAQEQIVDGTES